MDIIQKYNISVPRYTSYPPANFFEPMDSDRYIEAIDESNHVGSRKISFYIHAPFCRHLCHYCGCNSFLLPRTGDAVARYVEAIHREIDLVAAHLDRARQVAQIHYGGGSPTALPVDTLREINEHILSLFPTIDHPEIAIECHPAYLTAADWQSLTESHFNRFSIGVQDMDERVLKAVNRMPSRLPLQQIVDLIHSTGATVNMDFLYGLPLQTAASFAESIARAIEIRPDRLVTFGYGHVPWVFKRQQILEKIGLPDPGEKQRMFDHAARLLHEAGYRSIGLDHFVLPEDELFGALQDGLLYRNFQGYCTRRTTGQVYALGVTGISQLDTLYAQNSKDIETYIAETMSGRLSTAKGYALTPTQRVCKEVIERLMCNYRIRWSELADTLGIARETIFECVHYDKALLEDMAHDGIITLSDDGIAMTKPGHPFVRNVAAALDPLMQHTDKQFSKPI